MKRFFGMMPTSEIERTEYFRDDYDEEVRIDAGPNGWTVYYCDGSTRYCDESLTTDENFTNAYNVADSDVGPLTPMKGHAQYECVECVDEDYNCVDEDCNCDCNCNCKCNCNSSCECDECECDKSEDCNNSDDDDTNYGDREVDYT